MSRSVKKLQHGSIKLESPELVEAGVYNDGNGHEYGSYGEIAAQNDTEKPEAAHLSLFWQQGYQPAQQHDEVGQQDEIE